MIVETVSPAIEAIAPRSDTAGDAGQAGTPLPLAAAAMRVAGPDGPVDIPVTVDLSLIDPDGERDTHTIFQAGAVLLVIDGYPSNAGKAGDFERWVRIIDMHDLKERYAVHVESGSLGINPGHPVLGLEGHVITINIEGKPPLVLHVADDLTVTPAP